MTIERVSTGATYQAWLNDWPFFTTINEDDQGNITEIFIRIDDHTKMELAMTISRLVSMSLRQGVPVNVIAEELQQIASGDTQHMLGAEMCPSLVAHVGKIIEGHLNGRN